MRILIAVVGLSVPASEAWAQSAGEVPADDAVVVTATREREKLVDTPASIGVISGDTVARDRPSHPSQIVSQIPGVAVAVTNGEGHTSPSPPGRCTSFSRTGCRSALPASSTTTPCTR